MPEPKNRYSDSELNPSEQAYENEAEGHDSSSGDAVAHDLRRSEEGLGPIQKRLQQRDNKQQELREAEANDWNNPENKFYRPTEKTEGRIRKWSNKRKAAVIGGGAGSVLGIISLMFLLLPMKVPGILAMITQQAGQRVEQITEKRAKLIIGRAILTKFGTNTGVVLTGEGAFKTLVASMRTNGFEKRLAAKGLIITPDADGVKLTYKGERLGNGKTFKNESAIVDALDSNKLTNKMLKDVIKEEIPSWRWMKRAKFAKWLRIKYGIPRYGLPNSEKGTEEERKKDTDTYRAKAANSRTIANFKLLVSCVMSGTCDKVNDTGQASETSQADAEGTAAQLEAAALEVEADVTDVGLEDATKKMPKILIDLFGSKAIPIIGWIDIVATIDHFVYKTGDDDYLGKVAAYFKGAAYAGIYADWAGYGSQGELGAMNPEYMGVLAKELDGAETAQFFQAVEGNTTAGIPIETIVGSDKPSEFSTDFKQFLETPGGQFYKNVGHTILNAYYETFGGGGFLGWAGGMIGDGIGAILGPLAGAIGNIIGSITPESLKSAARDTLASIGEYVMKQFGLTIDPLETGPKLMNNIAGGAEVSFNEYCKEIGCRRLDNAETAVQNNIIAQENSEYLKQKGLVYSLFSNEEPSSVTTQLAITLPSTPAGSISSLSRMVSDIPIRLASIFTPRSSAASYTNLYGVAMFGATSKDLNRPLSTNFLESEPCPKTDENEFDDCSVDKTITEGMICEFDPESIDCRDTDPETTSENAVGGFRIASYNFLGDNHTGGNVNDSARFDRAMTVVEDNEIDIVGLQEFQAPQFDRLKARTTQYDIFPDSKIYGTDATSANSIIWDNTKFKLKDSGTRPFKYFGGTNNQMPWVLLENHEGSQSFYVFNVHDPARPENADLRYQNALAHAAMVKEFSAKGKEMFFTGDFNSGYYPRSSNNITFEGKRENLTYCIMTRDGIMQNSFDNWQGKSPGTVCPTARAESPTACKKGHSSNNENSVDHIYVSKSVTVSCYWTIDKGIFNNGSDVHDTIIADIAGPETSSNAGSEFRIGTYNLPIRAGESGYRKAVENMKNRNFEVVGMQELAGENYRYLQREMKQSGYSIYPDKKPGDPIIRHGSNSQSIFWKNEKFELVESSIFNYPRYGEDPAAKSGDEVIRQGWANTPIIKLRDKKTGQVITVINIHNAAYARNDKRRFESAQIFIEQIKKVQDEDPSMPVFLTGDFNEGTGVRKPPTPNVTYQGRYQNLLYCMFAENNLMVNTKMVSEGKGTICPNSSIGGVDYIYASKGIDAKNYSEIPSGAASASDHPVHFTDINVPGDKKGGWVWPLKQGLKPGPCWGAYVYGRQHAGMDINTDVPNNQLVAMHNATITEAGYDGDAGNYIKFKATNGMYYIYQHLKSISKRSGTVSAGEVVGIAGKTGNVSASSAAHFHLVVSKLNDFPSYDRLGGSINPLSVLPKPAPGGYTCTQ